MPNDVAGQIMKLMGVSDPRYDRPQKVIPRGMAEDDLPVTDKYDYVSGDEILDNPEAGMFPSIGPALHESELFQQAAGIFTEQTGTEPATDSDFMEVVEIMRQLQDEGAVSTEDTILQQMGEE